MFALNAVLSVVAAFVICRWKREQKVSALPGERFIGAMRVGWQYVRESRAMHASAAHLAVLPARDGADRAAAAGGQALDGGGAGTFTLLLASMGVGAIVAALLLPRLRAHGRATSSSPTAR